MLQQRVAILLLMSSMTSIWTLGAVAKIFEKTRDPDGTVTCALDEPSLVIPLDQLYQLLSNGDSCVAPGALCASQCARDPDCTSYNYRAHIRVCAFFHYTPTTCSPVVGCYHAEVSDNGIFEHFLESFYMTKDIFKHNIDEN